MRTAPRFVTPGVGVLTATLLMIAPYAVACGYAPKSKGAVRLSASPSDSLLDGRLRISLKGLRPNSRVTVVASEKAASNKLWVSRSHFGVDPAGSADIPSGTKLLWSMRPNGSKGDLYSVGLWPKRVATVTFKAVVSGSTRARAAVTRRTALPGLMVEKTSLKREGFIGRLYLPPHAAQLKRPGILLIGGSEGGFPPALWATVLASHGYPTLALAYFGLRGLPQHLLNIRLEYFERALIWFGEQPGVDASRLVAFGGSRGAEAALLLGSTYPQLVHGVAAYSPSAVINPGIGPHDGPAWLLGGKPLPSASPSDPFGSPDAFIAVERIDGPIFLVAGGLDALWRSDLSTRLIVKRLRAHERRDFTSLVYPHAGHLVDIAVPNFPVSTVYDSPQYGPLSYGGSVLGDALARARSWPQLLRFLDRT